MPGETGLELLRWELGCVVGEEGGRGMMGPPRESVEGAEPTVAPRNPSLLPRLTSCATETFHHSDHTCNN